MPAVDRGAKGGLRAMTARLLTLVLAAAAPAPLAAQAPTIIESGETIEVAKGAADSPAFYALVGRAGEEVQFDVTTTSPVTLSLFTSEGEWMLDAEGTDGASLTAFLPNVGVFLVSVSQSDPAAFTLAMNSREPDAHLEMFSLFAGYEWVEDGQVRSLCWVKPGLVVRHALGPRMEYIELGRGGREYVYESYPGGPIYFVENAFTQDKWTAVVKGLDGSTLFTSEEALTEDYFGRPDKPNARFVRYLCD